MPFSKEELEKLYINDQKSLQDIAKIYNVTKQCVYYQFNKFGIKTRSSKEACSLDGSKNKLSISAKKSWTQERIFQFSENQKGEKNHMFGKFGKEHSKFGYSATEETRKKISESHKKLNLKGPNNPNWRGNRPIIDTLRSCIQYHEWRKKVYERDEYICIKCGYSEGRILNADHIYPFALLIEENNIKTYQEGITCEKLWDINNGQTLCVECHKKTSTWGCKLSAQMRKNKNATIENAT